MAKTKKEREAIKKEAKKLLEEVPDIENIKFEDIPPADITPIEELKESLTTDIFDYCAKRVAAGDQIRYEIEKDGYLEGYKFHPYSWEQLQKDFGQGSYKVVARSTATKKYVKAQTRAISAYRPDERDDSHAPMFNQGYTPPSKNEPNFIELMSLMNEINSSNRQEARELAREQATQNNSILQSLLSKPNDGLSSKEMLLLMSSMMQNANKKEDDSKPMLEFMLRMMDNSQKTAQQLSENTNRLIDKMNENSNRMFEKMNDRFQTLAEKLSSRKKDGELGIAEIMMMTENAQKKGFDLFNKMQQLAESKADEKFELMEALKPEGGIKEKKSMTETLIENLLPTITSAVAHSKNIQAPPQRPLLPQTTHEPRRSLRQGTQNISKPQTSVDRRRNQENKIKEVNKREKEKNIQNSESSRSRSQVSSIKVGGSQGIGVPSINFSKPNPKPALKKTPAQPELIDREQEMIEQLHPEQKAKLRDFIENLLTQVIGKSLLNRDDPKQAAEKMIQALLENNVSLKLFLHIIEKSYIIEVIRKFNLPQEVKPWFEEAYDYIENKSRNRGDRRESTTS